MKVCTHQGLVMVILTRNEHCPPHVHVGTAAWDARFEFSFWHNGVRLWDVVPAQHEPKANLLEALRQVLKEPANLQRARAIWWQTRQTLCLDNLLWDRETNTVVKLKAGRPGVGRILSAHFNAETNQTRLQLAGESGFVEIEL